LIDEAMLLFIPPQAITVTVQSPSSMQLKMPQLYFKILSSLNGRKLDLWSLLIAAWIVVLSSLVSFLPVIRSEKDRSKEFVWHHL